MFVFNIKLNKGNFARLFLSILIIIAISLTIAGTVKIFKEKNELEIMSEECMPQNEIAYLTNENYTNILKEVHENLETYIGQKISYTGYVYRVPEIEENQFILARDMKINDQTDQTVIVGFLCQTNNAKDFDTYTWVSITGTIEKGYYFGDIPCINISDINVVDKPENATVNQPNEKFIPTAVIY